MGRAKNRMLVNDRVRGSTKKLKNKVGKVIAIVNTDKGRKATKARVLWDSGGGETDESFTSLERVRNEVAAANIPSVMTPTNEVPTISPNPNNLMGEDDDDVHPNPTSSSSSIAPDPNQLNPHNQKWEECNFAANPTTPAAIRTQIHFGCMEIMKIQTDTFDPLDCFLFVFPFEECFATMVAATTANLKERKFPVTNQAEMLRFFGLQLAMVLEPKRGGVPAYWHDEVEEESVMQPGRFGKRFSMARNRFQALMSCLSFQTHNKADDWSRIRPFLDAINQHKAATITPGSKICCDESMSFWSGLNQTESVNGIPHSSKEPRKPANQGTEFKTAADVETGILLRLDVLEGEDIMNTKRFRCAPHNYPAGTAFLLRLTEPWHHKIRTTVVADSYFSSTISLEAMSSVGFHFMGSVKTATRRYPKEYLQQWYNQQPRDTRGSFKLLKSTYSENGQSREMFAACWQDEQPKFLVFNAFSSAPGDPSIRTRNSKEYENGVVMNIINEIDIPRPEFMQEFFHGFPIVDIHDHYRQGSLGFEDHLMTEEYSHRVFHTLLGMLIVDAFLLYRWLYKQMRKDPGRMLTFKVFSDKLSYKLIFNPFYPKMAISPTPLPSPSSSPPNAPHCSCHRLASVQYAITELKKLDTSYDKKDIQLTCRICKGRQTRYFCLACTPSDFSKLFGVCSQENDVESNCFSIHSLS